MLFQYAFLSLDNTILIVWDAFPSLCEVTLAYPTTSPPPQPGWRNYLWLFPWVAMAPERCLY